MNFLVNLAMKWMGLQSAVDALDGETSKAYLGGVGLILGGLGSVCAGLAGIVAAVVPLQGGAAYLAYAQNLSHDTNAGLVLAGYAAIMKGYADIGNRHATAKLAQAVAVLPAAPVAAAPVVPAPAPAAVPAPPPAQP